MQYSKVCSTVECSVQYIVQVPMRLSHLTLLHKGQASTRYYRWLTRYVTLYYTLHTPQVCNTVLHTTHSPVMQHCTTHYTLTRYATLYYTLHTIHSPGMQHSTTHLMLQRASRNLHYSLYTSHYILHSRLHTEEQYSVVHYTLHNLIYTTHCKPTTFA